MKKRLTNTTVYEPNNDVKLKVVNKPLVDPDTGEQYGYDTVVTITVTRKLQPEELRFSSDDDIAEFMAQVDYDESQQRLL
jgi:hypothetical protein|nr:MAG TPA: hypothetical protein [Caudoviricetes sp.]